MAGGLQPPSKEDEEQAAKALKQGVIFVLEDANLEVAKVGKSYVLLNCDDNSNFLRKHGRDLARSRPDICHQAMLAILDSPLNKSGKVKGLYVRTNKNVLIEVSPAIRLPRTFKRFCGLMVQLLQKLSIRASNGPNKLMKVVKGPVTKYFPLNCRRIGFSHKADTLTDMHDFAAGLPDDEVVVFVLGAFAHGRVDSSMVDQEISISGYPLSAACAISRITNALERKWGVL